jgi:hypothetical protein
LATTPDPPGTSPEIRRVNDNLRQEYRQIIADLARYDRMRSFRGASEFGAAALGQFGGGMLSPESWVGLGAKGATWLWRAAKAGLQQGAVNAATDPFVQGLNIKAGAQDQYDPWRTAIAGSTGFVAGATAKLLAEALSPSRFFDPRLTRAERLSVNRSVGRAWEERAGDLLRQFFVDVSPQVTLMPQDGPPTRVDWIARHPVTGDVHCFECKSSKTARLTPGQMKSFPKVEAGGAAILGAGKAAFPGGSSIAPTKVKLLLPPEE